MPTDAFMLERTGGAENKPVAITDICKFGRMKRFQPYSEVVAALKDSGFLDVSGEEGVETVKRKVAWKSESRRAEIDARSIYVKGFGEEEPSSQFDIEAFFAPYGPTNAVRLRRSDDKRFKGSVFVEFQDEETAKKFLELDPKPLWKGEELKEIKSKNEYQNGKNEEIREGKLDPKGGDTRGRGRGGFRDGRGKRDREGRDPDDWKTRREHDRKHGFKDDRKGGNRGGRGRGRGRGRDDRGPRSNDRNQEREDKEKLIFLSCCFKFPLTLF
jgi:lupus La protein